ncbi:AraC family transcriptional regulator [Cryptosporangium aurantiacum]|uniref:AraC family transcriptional regulator, L-rhamnose operon transcriptional activator RhaR n=1 Tax=Cryptosporangium aurantiacum TaxID=134849 RepID=A0A1M7NAE3_9ACTN|nr:AraC family transcriptional regulator [Cryptosporangium aurantiacum]SHN00108.1 AraC family transcriptional regulator, L-rhamnose operon transcriptional activator RhaR [Cryptosporangium aurantiacum]
MRVDPVGESKGGLLYLREGAQARALRYLHTTVQKTHTHSFFELAFVLGGEGTHVSPAGRDQLRRGDVVVLRPGVWHSYEECSDLRLYNLCFGAEILHRELAWSRADPGLGYLLWTGPMAMQRRGVLNALLPDPRLAECVDHLDALAELGSESTLTHRGDMVARLTLTLSVVGRAAAAAREGEPAGLTHPAVLGAMRLLEERSAYPWTLAELADELHLTPGYLVRLFKSATGLPPMAYLARHRVEKAAELLLDTDEPVTQIGQSVGWPDQNYFARRFKAHFGVTATTYRSQFAQNRAHLRNKSASDFVGPSLAG